jgi:hypothetical protein
MSSPSRLATALRHQARGVYCFEAAAELLIAHRFWLQRTDFTAHFVHVRKGLIDGRAMALIDWPGAITALQTGLLPCSGGEHRILRIAASLADGIPVDLQDVLTGLDDTNLDLVAATVLHAGGHRPHTRD